jgi:hypothetical protein
LSRGPCLHYVGKNHCLRSGRLTVRARGTTRRSIPSMTIDLLNG